MADYEDDYEENRQQQLSVANGPVKPVLGEFIFKKVDKDSWNCPTCDTPNSNSVSACVCCETLNPNTLKSVPTVPETQFKFGTSLSSSGFSFGASAFSTAAAVAATTTTTTTTTAPFCFRFPVFTSSNFSTATKTAAPIFSFPSAVPTLKSSKSVEIVFEKQPKAEHMDTIKKLMLPPNFYDYEDKAPCTGCIGCNDAINFSDLNQMEKVKVDLTNAVNSNTAPPIGSGK